MNPAAEARTDAEDGVYRNRFPTNSNEYRIYNEIWEKVAGEKYDGE